MIKVLEHIRIYLDIIYFGDVPVCIIKHQGDIMKIKNINIEELKRLYLYEMKSDKEIAKI
jgi:hypothetical protein